jgi:hypothetical protein
LADGAELHKMQNCAERSPNDRIDAASGEQVDGTGSMSFPDHDGLADRYRQRAIECYALANCLSDPDQQKVMRLLATCWLRLVDRADRATDGWRPTEPVEDRSAA